MDSQFVRTKRGVKFDKAVVVEKATEYQKLYRAAQEDHKVFRSKRFRDLAIFIAVLGWTTGSVNIFLMEEAEARLNHYNELLHPKCEEI